MKKTIAFLFYLFFCLTIRAAEPTAIDSLAMYHEATALNSGKIQQEMIYLHLDNTSYYRGDRIFFACYLVTSGHLKPSNMSKTVYAELLNPNGKIIDRCVLRPEDGRCHGSLLADETPFYSGYYEIRAYTRYMLNFGPEAIYSRVIPIYAAPKKEGDWSERTILRHDPKTLPMSRPKTPKIDKVDLKFYPEGGHLVNGLPARVAFELTDDKQRPLTDIAGRIVDRTNDSIVATFRSGHMGRGSAEFIPAARRYSAEMTIDGKRYWCDLPDVEADGIALRVDNLEDSIKVSISRTPDFPTEAVGVSLTCRGELYGRSIVDLSNQTSASFKMSAAKLPTGVCQLTLFNAAGQPISDRLFFHNRHEFVNVEYSFDKPSYRPFEKVELTVKLADPKTGAPVSAPFSISVTDADNHVSYGSNIMADLLLASEIKGYVHNPAYYFEDDHESDLDHLLMVQGWRRYRWSQLAGMEEMRLDSLPEQGIEIRGQVLERFRDRPKRNISVSAMLSKADTTGSLKTYAITTDSLGRFSLRDSLYGSWMMILSSSNKDEISNNRILLDNSERPICRHYQPGELVVSFNDIKKQENIISTDTVDVDATLPTDGSKLLREVEVTAQYTPEWWTAHYKENSVASYDIFEEINTLRDNGNKHVRTLSELLLEIDNHFNAKNSKLTYNGKETLLITDPDFAANNGLVDGLMGVYDMVGGMRMPTLYPENIPVDFIKNIYINTDQSTLMEYAPKMFPKIPKFEMEMVAYKRFGCVVFVEFHPDNRAELQSGVRRTSLNGYTENAVEFYHPNYESMPAFEPDYRRTLYWNPDVVFNSGGAAKVRFFNNSTTRRFHVSTATVAPDGTLGGI